MNKVYLASYHGRASKLSHRICDGITKFFTRGKYSHCEIAIALPDGRYECYTSSYRDGGVRCKVMDLPSDKWELTPLSITHEQVKAYFKHTQGAGYDLWGALGAVALFHQSQERYFCSEWCYNAIFGSDKGWRFSPSDLYDLILAGEHR
ncbi:enoyl-CoA hydratase [Moraxella sp. ZY200743]|uniref:enoyl-CoA hydratase n=1 Tax=Moraxella sp. ZY200743 TaxID=2911970 RepID=UPI003D7E2B5C